MYQIIDATSNIRDKAMLLMLFQSGIRVNALCHLKLKDVKTQLYREEGPKIPLQLRITDEIDTKLRGYSIDFYDIFLQGEAVEALKAYCDSFDRDGDENAPLFYTKIGNPMNRPAVWETVKRCVRRARIDPDTIWVHTIRKAFKRVGRHTPIDDDFKEAIMGHVLPGSRENYFSRKDPEEIEKEYMKIDFSREIPESEVQKLRSELRLKDEAISDLQNKLKEQSVIVLKWLQPSRNFKKPQHYGRKLRKWASWGSSRRKSRIGSSLERDCRISLAIRVRVIY